MRLVRLVRDIIVATLATAGIRLDKLYPHRILLIAVNILFFIWMLNAATFTTALIYFLTVFTLRYVFLFTSFISNGIADRLIRRYGEEKGYEIYETITATMFFHGGSAFSCLVDTTQWTLFGPQESYPAILSIAGPILSLLGFTVNIWSTLIIGVDIYYYKDLFLRRFITEFKVEGPYRIFSNPMYGIGQSAAYGTGLANGSIAGIIATMMNQTMMYIFYFTIEKPHIMRMIAATGGAEPPLETEAAETGGLKPAKSF